MKILKLLGAITATALLAACGGVSNTLTGQSHTSTGTSTGGSEMIRNWPSTIRVSLASS